MIGHLQQFNALLERQPDFLRLPEGSAHRTIRCVRNGMGSYYTSDEFRSFLSTRGIVQQFSAPYVPQQNGHAERLNRTLIEATRSTLHSSKLDFQFWGEVLTAAAYTYNLSSHSSINNKSPHECLFGFTPSLNQLRALGSKCTYLLEAVHPSKFAPSGTSGILVGYTPYSKAYRVWDPIDRKIVTSGNVSFDEDAVVTIGNTAPSTAESAPNSTSTVSYDSPPTNSYISTALGMPNADAPLFCLFCLNLKALQFPILVLLSLLLNLLLNCRHVLPNKLLFLPLNTLTNLSFSLLTASI